MTSIIPAILPKRASELDEKLNSLPEGVREIQIDILDEDVWSEEARKFDIEVHIMSSTPLNLAKAWAMRGASRIIVHKLSPEILDLRQQVALGLGVEMNTPLEQVFGLVPSVDFVQFMSIAEIGEQGHAFETKVFDRIKEFKERFPNVPVGVDGGVDVDNFKQLEALGVERVAVGSKFKEVWSSQTKE